MELTERVERLRRFREMLQKWSNLEDSSKARSIRSRLNEEVSWIRRQVVETNSFKTFTIAPPPAVGGLIFRDADPFAILFDPPYGVDMTQAVVDMVDETIGVLQNGDHDSQQSTLHRHVQEGYAFVAMPMRSEDPALDDVYDSIREAARRCGVEAERIDQPQSNERITDRILESIGRAQFVIADLTDARPNVYFEAGYAHGLGKTPIYVARAGTDLEFDLKDYPVIFFKNMRQLKDALENRMRGIAGKQGQVARG